MKKNSAGILLYRHVGAELQVLLVHPGGPFWARKDAGAWSIPKGEIDEEEGLAAARREFHEELGAEVEGDFVALTPVRQRSGKIVAAWAVEGDFDPGALRSNTFQIEWPPRSGKMAEFPEVDRAGWFGMAEARQKLLPAQVPLLDELVAVLVALSPPRA